MGSRVLSEQEFQQVRDSVLASAPPNMDEATFTRWVGPQMAAALEEAETRSATPEGSAVGRFGSGVASMLNPVTIAKGAYQAVRHPLDTGTAVVSAMGDELGKARELASQGRYVEALGHGAAGVIPLIGPTAAAVGEQAAQGDIAGAAGATAGLLAPTLIKPAVKAAGAVMPNGLRATVAEHLESKAGQRYADVMAPQVGPNKTRFGNQAAKVGPTLAKNPEMRAWSRTGLQGKVEQAFEAATQQLDEAADASLATASLETKPILTALRTARQKLVAEAIDADRPIPSLEGAGGRPTPSGLTRNIGTGRMQQAPQKRGRPLGKNVEPAPNAPRIGALDSVIREVEQLGPLARYESLRRIRQAWDAVAKQVYMPSATADLLKLKGASLGAADATGALREGLAAASPKMALANEAYSLHKTARDVLKATEEVERTRPRVGRAIMTRLTTTVAGGQQGGVAGAAAGYVLGPIVDAAASMTPTMRLQTAQLMTRLAKAIRGGEIDQVSSLIWKLKRLTPAGAVSVTQQTAPVVAAREEATRSRAAAR